MRKEDISIIIVDDLHFSREVFKSGLKKSGYDDVRTASSAEEALFQLNQRRASVVLADFWMPNLNGLELTDLIRKWDENNDRYTGIVLLTAEDTTASIVVAFDRGVDDFVSKSADQFEVAARVYGAARTAIQQNELRSKAQQISAQYQQLQKSSLIDKETGLENKFHLLGQLEAMIQHAATRGGGVGLGIIKITDKNNKNVKLRKGTLRTIANSLKLVMRPLDVVCRLSQNSFAIAIHVPDVSIFNSKMFTRLMNNIKNRTRETDDTGQSLVFLSNLYLAEQFEPLPNAADIIDKAMEDLTAH